MAAAGQPPRLGVCSWSLQTHDLDELLARVAACGVTGVQLALEPLRRGVWSAEDTLAKLTRAGVEPLSGMLAPEGEDYSTLDTIRATGGFRPDATWGENRGRVAETAYLARRLGLELVTFHAGFLPHGADDPERAVLLDRLRHVADVFADQGVAVALETGQETAETLEQVLHDLGRPSVGVNFDPANMLLYGMGEPVEALERLLPWVRQVHVKDARRAADPGQWGEEVPVGIGEVRWDAFFDVLARKHPRVDLVIEREAGDARVADVATARALVEREAARVGLGLAGLTAEEATA